MEEEQHDVHMHDEHEEEEEEEFYDDYATDYRNVDWDLLTDKTKYIRRRRMPIRPRASRTDIYVNHSRNLEMFIKRACNLLENEDVNQVKIYGMGAAMNQAIDVALMTQRRLGGSEYIQLGPKTHTQVVTDEYEPIAPGLEFQTIERFVSQVSIEVMKLK